MYLVEVITRSGPISETFATYEAAAARVARIPEADLLTMPLIYQDLPDGSQRIVREDGKPLQAHRPTLSADLPEAALPLSEEDIPLGELRAVYTPQDESDEWINPLDRLRPRVSRDEDDPLPLAE